MAETAICEICQQPAVIWVRDYETWDDHVHGYRYCVPKELHIFCQIHRRDPIETYCGDDGKAIEKALSAFQEKQNYACHKS